MIVSFRSKETEQIWKIEKENAELKDSKDIGRRKLEC